MADAPQHGAIFTISATINGFPVTVQVTGRVEQLSAMIEKLYAAGAEPPAAASVPKTAAPASADEAPVCKYHGPMKPSKFGGFHCTRKMGDGTYCNEKAE